MKPKLQVALDLLEFDRAIQIAKEAVEGGADWIEAGTPLIKSVGMDIIRILREKFPDKTIVADMKTMDTGAIEVEMAAKAGADIVSILAAADNSTIEDALRSAREYGVQLMVDLINVPDPVKKAKELEEIGVDYICVHVGIDQQMVGVDTIELLEAIVKEVETPLAVGGGLDAESSAHAIAAGAEVVIVGGNIIRSADVTGSTRLIREAIDNAEITDKKRETIEEETIRLFMEVSTPNISDAMHREPCMRGIRPIFEGIKVAGRAVTVQTFGGDWAKTVEAIDVAGEGDILVIFNGSDYITPWGELASHSAQNRGIAALVIDGPVRDIDDIREMRFPIFASGIVSNAGDPKGFGEINAEITCGGVKVRPGDYIVGDDNGVMVIPKERGYEIARRAMEVKKNEDRVREEIRRGKTLSQVIELYKWEKKQK
ncbi:MAG: iron-sulfur cluster assembly protein HesB [Candidatus Syntrophoarchaeum caldarius]|uniref:3-hexulose-6-phosphate synthase n=1 Tax=Candidatus Syntropharchaeum caldarium TaxID=1838285 RepID=A0A1F2PA01_9EURY|nr:MAG: iron-sulfur cluster assembly protein HesB [Candidatus Syntrophoarchaeum caldarius]